MSIDAAHKSAWQIGEVVFGIPFLVAIFLQFALPVSIFSGSLVAGAALIIAGVGFIALARREFGKQEQPTDPGYPTTRIVTSGVFSISRNPIYLGAVLFLAGLGLAIGSLWVLIFLLPSLVACHYVLILPEERYLAAKFGDAYRLYTASVHRWIGRAPR